MTYSKFDSVAAEKVRFYVYALRDPRYKEILYIGKRKGNRWFEHIQAARSDTQGVSRKLARIQEIEDSGFEVEAFVIRSGIASERVAYRPHEPSRGSWFKARLGRRVRFAVGA